MERQLYAYTYVEHPFDEMARLLTQEPRAILQSATDDAATRARDLRAEVHVDWATSRSGGTSPSSSVTSVPPARTP